MKPIIRTLSVALFLTLVACGGGVESVGPVGLWRIDSDATLAANQLQIEDQLAGMPPAERAEAKKRFEGLFKSVQGTIELSADKTLVSSALMGGKKQVMYGTWELDGDKIKMTSSKKGSDVDFVVIGSISNDNMTVNNVGKEQFMVFKRN